MQEELAILVPIDPREVWETEDQHFTPWLAKDKNLDLLGETLNMELEREGQEVPVGDGNFRADILCKKLDDGTRVLIENQLEVTDHNHLGQILTYAAGLDAYTVIWIAKEFREEHRAALDRLNEMDEDFRFFGIEIKVWQIEDSRRALQFEIVSKPNDWNRTVRRSAVSKDLTDGQLLCIKFWTGLRDYMNKKDSRLRFPKPGTATHLQFSIGRTGFSMNPFFRTQLKVIGITLYVKGENATEHFHLLKEQQAAVEKEFGESLEWAALPDYDSSRISLRKEGPDPGDESDWPKQHEWLASKLELFDKIFRPRIQELDADDWVRPEGEDEE